MTSNEWKFRLEGHSDWRKSLRGQTGAGVPLRRAKPRRHKSSSDELFSLSTKAPKARKLSLVEEESCPYDNLQKEPTCRGKPSAPPRPAKKGGKPPRTPLGSCDLVVEPLSLNPRDLERVGRETIVSPIPLPPGVICIDPSSEDEPLLAYLADNVKYVRGKEEGWLLPHEEIVRDKTDLPNQRRALMTWLMELASHFDHSQETLYHAVGLVDSTLFLRDVQDETLQLVAITALMLAAKLEEYYPPAIDVLLELTENSYKRSEVVQCERKLLDLHGFTVYSAEPMVFMNRFVQAAFRQDDSVFLQTCLLFLDSMIPCIEYSSILASKKVAAAVFAAMQMRRSSDEPAWTPTLAYYSGYVEDEVCPLGFQMMDQVVKCLRLCISKGKDSGVVRKYMSRSRHGGLLRRPDMQLKAIEEKLKTIRKT